jgi:hypothetical protein
MTAETMDGLPDLSGLNRESRIILAVEKIYGATWRSVDDPFADVEGLRKAWMCGAGVLRDSGEFIYTAPSPLYDSYAWGLLLAVEMCGWESDERGHRVKWWQGKVNEARVNGPWAPTLSEAVCTGLLAKHGVEVPQ